MGGTGDGPSADDPTRVLVDATASAGLVPDLASDPDRPLADRRLVDHEPPPSRHVGQAHRLAARGQVHLGHDGARTFGDHPDLVMTNGPCDAVCP